MADPRVDELARILVHHSTAVKAGEVVQITGEPAAEPLLLACYREVLRAGAHPLLMVGLEEAARIYLVEASSEQLDYLNPISRYAVERSDALIRIEAPSNTRQLAGTDPERLVRLGRARRELVELMLARRWVLTQYPTQALAQDAAMALVEFEDFLYGATNVDWAAFRAAMLPWRDRLNAGRELRIVGPGTDLRLATAGRTWLLDSGEHNMPGGEIFTGPLEDSAEGHITFSFPAIYGGREVEGIRLQFAGGRVTRAEAQRGQAILDATLGADEGARRLGEIGIGLSPGINRFVRSILFDEKIKGTVHLAVGRSYDETGGVNQSAIHWDMICDLRRGGEIYLDGQLIQRNGEFVA